MGLSGKTGGGGSADIAANTVLINANTTGRASNLALINANTTGLATKGTANVAENVGFVEILTDRDFEESTGSWRPIYKKMINCGNLPSSDTTNTAHSVANISRIIKSAGFCKNNNDYIPIPFATYGSTDAIKVWCDLTNINLTTYTTWTTVPAFITLEYTKTTDSATANPRYTTR